MKTLELIFEVMTELNHHPSDQLAFDRISVTQPFWRGFENAKNQLGVDENVFLHAGPAFTSIDDMQTHIEFSRCWCGV